MNIFIIKKKFVFLFLIICLALITGWILYMFQSDAIPATTDDATEGKVHVINLVTGEFKATTKDGKEIEAYRFDPGTIFVNKEEDVKISIRGINGKEHPFIIEGTNIKGTVKQGEETIIPIRFDQQGVYRLICLTHFDKDHNGPMIAYIVVD